MNDDDPTLVALSSAVDSIESRYLTCGQFSMPAPLQITASGGQTATFPIKRGEQLTEIKKLTDVAAPSPFGLGGETVVNTAVRQASQVSACASSTRAQHITSATIPSLSATTTATAAPAGHGRLADLRRRL